MTGVQTCALPIYSGFSRFHENAFTAVDLHVMRLLVNRTEAWESPAGTLQFPQNRRNCTGTMRFAGLSSTQQSSWNDEDGKRASGPKARVLGKPGLTDTDGILEAIGLPFEGGLDG